MTSCAANSTDPAFARTRRHGATAHDVVAFWRDAGRGRWFRKNAAFDLEIARRFAAATEAAQAGALEEWRSEPQSALALILLLDQFPRNIWRGSPRAFAGDARAAARAEDAIARRFDRLAPAALRAFFYMPFMHSERLADQERCVALFTASAPGGGNLRFAREHRDIIRRFGRFPHRNAVLGRRSTAAEIDFLRQGGFRG